MLKGDFCMFKFINPHEMPPYLNSNNFDDWLIKFNNHLHWIGICHNMHDDVKIKFENQTLPKEYGLYTLDEIKNKIRKKWGSTPEIEAKLKKVKCKEDAIGDQKGEGKNEESLIEIILKTNPCERPVDIYGKINGWFDNLIFNVDVLGDYKADENMITLYTKTIEKNADVKTFEENFEAVFVHELFHAYHYLRGKNKDICRRNDYTTRVIKESFATAFEYSYCEENSIAMSTDYLTTLRKHSVVFYPYSGAIMLESFPCTSYQLDKKSFYKIFGNSIDDMDLALRTLLDTKDFYDIKNLVEIAVGKPDLFEAFVEISKNDGVGEIAQREIPSIVRKNHSIIKNLTDAAYCKKTFGVPYAVLTLTPAAYPCGSDLYYVEPVIKISGGKTKKQYYLFKHFKSNHRNRLLKWVWKNR